jgi:hypothetical protein
MKKWLFAWFLLGRLALGLWQEMPAEERQIALNVCAQQFFEQNPQCEEAQIVAITLTADPDWIYFLAQCGEKTKDLSVWLN